MKNSETKEFVAYEYLSINVVSDKEPLYVDCYENFGWKPINNVSNNGLIDNEDYYINNYDVNGNRLINLKFKRDRRIPNKVKIVTLQKKCENGLKELDKLEKEPARKGLSYSLTIGFIGTVFLAISVFLITATTPIILLGTILGIIGLVLWGLAYPMYKKIKLQQEGVNSSLIEKQYDIIYDACEQARKLID